MGRRKKRGKKRREPSVPWLHVPEDLRPENCTLCGERLPRSVSKPGDAPVSWYGNYAHPRCADLEDWRNMSGWQSGGSGPRRPAPGDMG